MKVFSRLSGAGTRRCRNHPHLRTSLGYLKDIFACLKTHGISMYRMSSQLAPYLTNPDLPQFHRQIDESRTEPDGVVGRIARELELRLPFHPSQFVILNSPDAALNHNSVLEIKWQVEILDFMGLGAEAVVVIHVGGAYGDPERSREHRIKTYEGLPPEIRARLVLENDDVSFSAADALFIQVITAVPKITE